LFRQLKVIALAVAVLASPQARAQMPPPDTEGPPIHFRADLSADEESAVTESPGKGVAEFTLDRKTLRFSWKVTFSNLTSEPIGAAVRGPQTVGGEAGVQVDLAPNGFKKLPLEGSVILTDGQLEYLTTDRFYVNILTKKYPAGELRGQVNKQREPKPQVTQ
jgi:hypothetical protein